MDMVSYLMGSAAGGVRPTGTLTVTENGTYDVSAYASAAVNVAGSGGWLHAASFGADDDGAGTTLDALFSAANKQYIYALVSKTSWIPTVGAGRTVGWMRATITIPNVGSQTAQLPVLIDAMADRLTMLGGSYGSPSSVYFGAQSADLQTDGIDIVNFTLVSGTAVTDLTASAKVLLSNVRLQVVY